MPDTNQARSPFVLLLATTASPELQCFALLPTHTLPLSRVNVLAQHFFYDDYS
ncbi:MAG: hypothetical protein ACJ8BW_02510 [Ktedonobacteraceae bacterium]